ncbi:MAG: FAD-dependent oxidoreductase [Candidatus Bathyarchaeia archaeon]|nr:FAD-dependent oxidoreductase [Candidatus Bathyarchaeota archaeon]
MPRRIVIIGAHAAGCDAAAAARLTDRTSEIIMLTQERYAGYSRCGLPFVIGGHIKSFEDLIVFPPSYFKMNRIDLRTETTVTGIDTKAKTVSVHYKDGREETIQYDSLIIATGARAAVPPIKGREKHGVYTLRTIEDGQKIIEALKEARSAVVVGAGLIGLEIAVAFMERGVKTTVVELLPQILPAMLDKDIADMIQRELEAKGLRIITGKSVDEIVGEDKVKGVIVAGEQIPADIVVIATGVRGNVELAEKAGITLGETRLIKVNMRMETSVKDVYACGDCVESIHLVTKRPTVSQLGTTAVRQARVAGTNAAGGYAVFPGVLGAAVTKLFDMEIGAVGLTESFAERAGIEAVSMVLSGKTRASYYPGALPITIKLIVDKETEKIIGAQIIGGEGVAPRINALSYAIMKEMTLRELAKAETCYAPPLSETWDPVTLTAQALIRKIKLR